MEGSGNRSGEQVGRDHPEVVDVEMEHEARLGRAPDPIVVDLEAEEDDDDSDVIILDDTSEDLRAGSPEIMVLYPPPQYVDLISDSDSDVEVLETNSSLPGVVAVEEDEENFPGSVAEENDSMEVEEGARVVVNPNAQNGEVISLSAIKEESDEGFTLSAVKEELGEASPSTFSIANIKKELEDHPLGDTDDTGLATAMSQVAIEKARSKVLSYVDDGEIPGPSSAMSSRNRDPPANMVHQSDEEVPGAGDDIHAPVESEGDGAKPRIVYLSKPDFSSLSDEEKLKLRDRLLRRIFILKKKCNFKEYKPRYSDNPMQMENGYMTLMKKDENGVLRKLIIKPAECRAADELKADPAFELPPNPTPTYLELLLKKLPAENHPKLPAEEVNSEEFQGPEWDSQEDVDEFCRKFNESMAFVDNEREEEKKAKEAARLQQKENRKKARDAMLAQIEQCGGRRVTRLATGAIKRKNTSEQLAQSSSASVRPGRQQRKRKVSEIGTSTGIEINPVPTLDRPLSQPGPPLELMEQSPPPPPPPPPMPGTSQADEEGLPSTCPLENSAGWCAENLWEVEEIVDVKVQKNTSTGKRRNIYKVKWRGWEREHNSWVPEEDILSKDPIKEFWSRLGSSQANIEQEEEETRRQRSPSSTYFLP